MLVRLQLLLVWCANGAIDYFIGHWPWPLVLLEQLILLPIIFCPPKERVRAEEHDTPPPPPSPRPVRPAPIGYTGPFWNKPSPVYLQSNARPLTTNQEALAYIALLVPFAALIYLLWRY